MTNQDTAEEIQAGMFYIDFLAHFFVHILKHFHGFSLMVHVNALAVKVIQIDRKFQRF